MGKTGQVEKDLVVIGCAEGSVESPLDDRCERKASAQVELGFAAGCEAEEQNLLGESKAEAEALEKIQSEAGEGFGELLILRLLRAG